MLAKRRKDSTLSSMPGELVPLSITEQIVDSAPIECTGCENLFFRSSILANRVLANEITVVQAEEALQTDLAEHCRGRIARHASWGTATYACTYDVPLAQSGLRPRV